MVWLSGKPVGSRTISWRNRILPGVEISVRQVSALVEERDVDPGAVADRFNIDVADVYHALAYYQDHLRGMSAVEREREEMFTAFQESIERPDSVEEHGEAGCLNTTTADLPARETMDVPEKEELLFYDADQHDSMTEAERVEMYEAWAAYRKNLREVSGNAELTVASRVLGLTTYLLELAKWWISRGGSAGACHTGLQAPWVRSQPRRKR